MVISDSLLVDCADNWWRLIHVDATATASLLLEAKVASPLRYSEDFARSQDLPPTGELAPEQLRQVVLGWSDNAAAWQLGITLAPGLERASHWLQLLQLSQSQQDEQGDSPQQKGERLGKALARTLNLPFARLESDRESRPPAEPAAPPPLPALPLQLGLWRLQAADNDSRTLELTRQRSWQHQRQIAWYGLWTAVYLWVSISTLNHELGLPIAGTLIPDPAWLPYLGIAVAALLVLSMLRQAWLLSRQVTELRIDPAEQSISAWRGSTRLWHVPADRIQCIYASEILRKRGKKPSITHAEINLYLRDGSFLPILIDSEKNAQPWLPGIDPQLERKSSAGLRVLEPAAASTALQAASLHIAASLGELPLRYDRRYR